VAAHQDQLPQFGWRRGGRLRPRSSRGDLRRGRRDRLKLWLWLNHDVLRLLGSFGVVIRRPRVESRIEGIIQGQGVKEDRSEKRIEAPVVPESVRRPADCRQMREIEAQAGHTVYRREIGIQRSSYKRRNASSEPICACRR